VLKYIIERSIDGRDWLAIDEVPVSNEAGEIHTYKRIDTHPLQGINYYRIKSVDIDNKTGHSDVRSISFDELTRQTLKLYPNPASTFITFHNEGETALTIKIMDKLGRDVAEKSIPPGAISVDLRLFSSGIYQVIIFKNGREWGTTRFVKIEE
jgi:hypothetical protein